MVENLQWQLDITNSSVVVVGTGHTPVACPSSGSPGSQGLAAYCRPSTFGCVLWRWRQLGVASSAAVTAVAGVSLEAYAEAQLHLPLLRPHGEAGLGAAADGVGLAAVAAADAVVEVDSAVAVAAAAYG